MYILRFCLDFQVWVIIREFWQFVYRFGFQFGVLERRGVDYVFQFIDSFGYKISLQFVICFCFYVEMIYGKFYCIEFFFIEQNKVRNQIFISFLCIVCFKIIYIIIYKVCDKFEQGQFNLEQFQGVRKRSFGSFQMFVVDEFKQIF